MAVQSNQAQGTQGSSTTLTCVFTNAQIAGDSNTVCVSGSGFEEIGPITVVDTVGNSYAQQAVFDGGTGGNFISFIWSAVNIKAAGAGANTVTVTLANASFDSTPTMFIVEGPAASAVRVANANNGGFQSITTATVSLAGTSTNDYTVGFIAQSGSTAVTPTVGNIGTNTAAGEQTYDTTSGTPYCYLVEDGLSSGGTINVLHYHQHRPMRSFS